MKETLKKIKENKALKIIGNILYFLLFVIVLLMLVVVIMQRVTDNTITLGGYRMFTVATASMEPKYKVGDILIAKQMSENELQIGDAITYKGTEGSFKDKIVTHEIIGIREENGEMKITTKGIANDIADPEISSNQVLGEVVYKVQSLSFISGLIQNIYIFYFLIFVPIAIIIYKQIMSIIRSKEDKDENNEEK